VKGVPRASRQSSPGPLQAALSERDALMQKWLLAVADSTITAGACRKKPKQERRYAALPLARDLLPILDNLHRALGSRAKRRGCKPVGPGGADGFEAVSTTCWRSMPSLRSPHSISRSIRICIRQFNRFPAPGKPPLTVVAECERGYRMHERVVRPQHSDVSAPRSAS